MSTAPVAGVRIAHDVRGEGPPVLFVQGLGYGRSGWGPAPARLADRFTVVTFDNRGFGDSDKPDGPYTTAELANDALGVLDSIGVSRAHIVGASLGGMVAQELALSAPERVHKLALLCTTPGGREAFPMPQRTVDLMQQSASLEPREALRRFVVNALAPNAPEALVEEIVRYRVANPPDPAGWQAQAAAGANHDASSRLAQIDAPTLVVHGTADNVIDARNAQLIADAISDSHLELFEGAGHLFFWERPGETVNLLEEFLP